MAAKIQNNNGKSIFVFVFCGILFLFFVAFRFCFFVVYQLQNFTAKLSMI